MAEPTLKTELILRSIWFTTSTPWHQDWRVLGGIVRQLVAAKLWANFTHAGPAATHPLSPIAQIGETLRQISRPGRWELRTQADLRYRARVVFDVHDTHLNLTVGFAEPVLRAPLGAEATPDPLGYHLIDRVERFVRSLTESHETLHIPPFLLGPTATLQVTGVPFRRQCPPAIDPHDQLSSVWTVHDTHFASHPLADPKRLAALQEAREASGRYITLRWAANVHDRDRLAEALATQDRWMREHFALPRHPRYNAEGDERFALPPDLVHHGALAYSESRRWLYVTVEAPEAEPLDPYAALKAAAASAEAPSVEPPRVDPAQLTPWVAALAAGEYAPGGGTPPVGVEAIYVLAPDRDAAIALHAAAPELVYVWRDDVGELWRVAPPGLWDPA